MENAEQLTQAWLDTPVPTPNVLSELKRTGDVALLLRFNAVTNKSPEEAAALIAATLEAGS